ncbi:MAG: HTTM domain-containing protein, partial [Eudoraea sp.]|nr:HTTM domain-containing protein [Eudoraea sp.]
MISHVLFKKIDNSPLIIFRIFLGILISLECFGAIITGWVRKTLIEPSFTFSFIGFEWLQPLPGWGMYAYFMLMGTLGVLIAIGYKYRWSIISFTVLWTAVYLMQKTSYNNHYYLLILISFLMCFLPAHRYCSLDARSNKELQQNSMFGYVKWIIVAQLFLVYTYASIAKLYGDWLDFRVIEILMRSKASYPLVGDLLQQSWIHAIIGVVGIVFDLLIVPALLWKRTRKWAFAFAIFFHLFNSIVFQIGIFPYLALAFTVFFFEAKTIQKIFFKNKPFYEGQDNSEKKPHVKKWLLLGFSIYFLVQLVLPLRHYLIEEAVLWTEEGHRMSWRMMLRSRSGIIQFNVVDKTTGKSTRVDLSQYLTLKQQEKIAAYPDFIWQFSQRLKREYAAKGITVGVYAKGKVSINGRPPQPFIDPTVDLANEKWKTFNHHTWILPSNF